MPAVEVMLNSNVLGRGCGHSKKMAEQQAAKEALRLFGENNAAEQLNLE